MTLEERIVALHRALARARVPHAFGGALALAYWTLEPRGTRDIDVNVFVPAVDPQGALAALPGDVAHDGATVATIVRDGQVRLWWDDTPLDLFFDELPIHHQAAAGRRMVPFGGTEIPVLGPVELAVFKAMFDRTRDWADLEAMLEANTLDVLLVELALHGLLAPDDPRFARLAALA